MIILDPITPSRINVVSVVLKNYFSVYSKPFTPGQFVAGFYFKLYKIVR